MLFWAGAVVAVAAALRSTWSPCGLSMLSSITPFGERSRGHRFSVTAGWFLFGAVLGGACLGAGSAAVAGLAGALGAGAGSPAVLALGAALALSGSLLDAGVFGPVLPLVRRQVDDAWLSRYRPWVYGAGFGWQVGAGLATYVMTGGVFVLVALGGLSGSPAQAVILGLIFGSVRGSTVFLTVLAGDPGALRVLHRWLDRIGPAVRGGAAGVMGGVAVGLAGAVVWAPARHGSLGALAALAPAAGGAGLWAGRAGRAASTRVAGPAGV